MNYSQLFALLLCSTIIAAGPLTKAADKLTLVKDGKATATIVLPAATEYDEYQKQINKKLDTFMKTLPPGLKGTQREFQRKRKLKKLAGPGDEERLAVEELNTFIKKISGTELPVVRLKKGEALPKGNLVLIGSELATQAGLSSDLNHLDKDGLICRASENKLILSGKRARGTLYAVYRFLEDLGCRWVMPGDFGEIYPQMKTIETAVNVTENPSHSQRYFWGTSGVTDEFKRWTLRTKGNLIPAVGDKKVHNAHALSKVLRWAEKLPEYQIKKVRPKRIRVKQPDGSFKMETEEKEVWTLPDEYYAMRNSKLRLNTPNMANPKVWDLYAKYYIKYFNEHPEEDYVSVSNEDGLVIDERPESRKLDSLEVDPLIGQPTATDRLMYFYNKVIDKVVKVHPDKKFVTLVYSNNMTPPRINSLNPNLVLVMAPLTICPLHHVRDEKCKTNRLYHEWLEDWMMAARAQNVETYYYDYEPLGFSWNMAMICPRWGIIGKNYPYFHKLGLDGHMTQGYDDFAACGLDNYLMQRLYWDINTNYKDVIKDYCKARFGKAADTMMAYYDLLEKRLDEIPDLYGNEIWSNHLILDPATREKARALLGKALKEAKSQRSKAHVQTMVDLQKSTDAMCDAIELARKTGDYAKAAKMMETCFVVRDKLNKKYAHFMHPKRVDETTKVKRGYLTGGLYNQYKASARKLAEADASLMLPQYWDGMLDTRNHAYYEGYFKPGKKIPNADKLDITVMPDVMYKTQQEPAAFFYRTEVKIPKTFADKKVTLYFPALISRATRIWVNGKPVPLEKKDGSKDVVAYGPPTFWHNYDHHQEFDLTGYIEPGKVNTIAFRVYKGLDIGGSYRRPFLLANDREKTAKTTGADKTTKAAEK